MRGGIKTEIRVTSGMRPEIWAPSVAVGPRLGMICRVLALDYAADGRYGFPSDLPYLYLYRGYNQGVPARPSRTLEVVQNPHPDRDYEVTMTVPEFTCVCPITGQPDFATIRIRYVPAQHLVELKSLKLYMWSYRNEGTFHEDVTNRILNDFVAAAKPRWVEIVGDFNVRGGIKTEIRVTYGKRPEI